MKFYKWLLEMSFSVEEALEIFGLTRKEAEDPDKLHKRYRELSKKHHPDTGGDVKQMQKINVAYSVLKEMPEGKAKSDVRSDMEEWKRKEKEIKKNVIDVLHEKFDPEVYVKYLEKHSGKKFKHDVDWKKSGLMVGFNAEFYTEDMDILFHLEITANIHGIMTQKDKTLAGDKYDFDLMVERYAFKGNKKYRIGKRSFNLTRDHDFFEKPEKMFTKKKVKEIVIGESKKKFRRADMIESLKRKFNARIDTVDNQPRAFVPIGDGHTMIIDRMTMMGEAGWMINFVHDKNAKKDRTKTVKKSFTFMENEEALDKIKEITEACKKKKTVEDKVKVIENYAKRQKY